MDLPSNAEGNTVLTFLQELHTHTHTPSEVPFWDTKQTEMLQASLIMLQEPAAACTSCWAGAISECECRCVFAICKLLSDTKAQRERLVLLSADVNYKHKAVYDRP